MGNVSKMMPLMGRIFPFDGQLHSLLHYVYQCWIGNLKDMAMHCIIVLSICNPIWIFIPYYFFIFTIYLNIKCFYLGCYKNVLCTSTLYTQAYTANATISMLLLYVLSNRGHRHIAKLF